MTETEIVSKEGNHEYVKVHIQGHVRPRIRCRVCQKFRDENPPECRGKQQVISPVDRVLTLANNLETALGTAIVELIDGYEGREGTSMAWKAGLVAKGKKKLPEDAAIDQLHFLIEHEPVGFKYEHGKFTIVAGKRSITRDTLARTIEDLYTVHRPECPRCGSRGYTEAFGTFRHKFEIQSCDLCQK